MFLTEAERASLGASHPEIATSERLSQGIDRKVNRGPAWFRMRKELRDSWRKARRRLFPDALLVARGGMVGINDVSSLST